MGQLWGVAAVAGWLTLLAALALEVRRRWQGRREWSRKLVHIGTGAVLPIAWLFGIDQAIALPAAALVTLLAALNHRVGVLPAIEDIDRHSYGTIAYGASITLLLWLYWPQQPAAATAGVLVMALGDGLAGLLGPWIPSTSWRVCGQRKSLVGTAAMAGASLALLLLLRAVALVQQLPAPTPWALVAVAAVAVLLEQWSLLGIDNLTVPLAVGGLWSLLSGGLGIAAG
ncbi:MAG TPA: dolichol kinase [Synechococcales bacterium UBA10510]|jgi:phytol kinase|nr:dolichol kinase [Synechococcales bacterium UBA10510]